MRVPDMEAKVTTLLRYGPLRSRRALAKHLGVGVSTFNGWITGSSKSKEQWVPEDRREAFLDLFAEALPIRRASLDIEALVLGSTVDLERAFIASQHPLLEDLIADEGRTDTSVLHLRPDLGLVELINEGADHHLPTVKLNDPFLVEIRVQRSGYVLALHNADRRWGVVPCADGQVSWKVPAGPLLIPGIRNYRYVCMTEKTATGRQRLVLLASPKPFPGVVADQHRSGTEIDWNTLGDIAAHMATSPKHLREVHVLAFEVTAR